MVVTGAGGLLGRAVTRECRKRAHPVAPTELRTLDVTDPAQCRSVLREERPDWVLHCAAYTAVDRAEREEAEALRINRDGTQAVVDAADEVGARVLYPSTDYVFDGTATRPYRVTDPPCPLSAYGRSKLAGEAVVQASVGDHLVARTSWLYGAGGGNFVDTMLRLGRERDELRVVGDQTGRPTWAASLAATLVDLMERDAHGVFHVGDEGTATWVDLARATLDLARLTTRVVPVTTHEWGAEAPRPSYSVLDLETTTSLLGEPRPHWRTSLEAYLRDHA